MASTPSSYMFSPSPDMNTTLPHTPTHWNLELQHVKLLYLQRQYKQCAARASELLQPSKEPVHAIYQSYLWFYSAISYEALGRAAHNYSSKKLAFLHASLDGFTACSAVLPSVVSSGSDYDSSTGDTSLAEMSFCGSDTPDPPLLESHNSVSGLVGSLARIIDDSMVWDIEEDPFISSNEKQECFQLSGSASFKFPREDSGALLLPSPLQIRKASEDMESDGSEIPASANDEGHDEHTACPSSTRYNDVQFLRSQITTSITAIQALIDGVTQQQRSRKATKTLRRAASYWSFSPVQPDSDCGSSHYPGMESKEERIARLRAEGWSTVGLRNGLRGWKGAAYYQAYSNAVLDELYLA